MKKEDLNTVYGEPSESFHNCVVQTLDGLEEKTYSHSRGSGRKKAIAIVAVAAALCTFTVTAAATNMFGLTATKRGTYGLNVMVESSSKDSAETQPIKLKLGYLPDAYSSGRSGSVCYMYDDKATDTYFNAWIYNTDHFDHDYTNVVKTEETEIDGHNTLIITFKEAENTDKLFYTTLKYFDEYGCLVRCNCTDYDELMKITEKAEVEPDTDHTPPADAVERKNASSAGAMSEYASDDAGFRDEYFAGKVHEKKIGDSMELSVADHEQNAVHVTAKVTSVNEQDNADGLEIGDFIYISYSKFFDGNGDLIKQEKTTIYEGADDDHLGTAKTITMTRHFYVADIELKAQEDIDDLYKAFGIDAYCIDVKNNYFYGYFTLDYGQVLKAYQTKINDKLSLKKGETANIKVGFITEKDTEDISYIAISAVDAPNDLYQNYMIKLKK